MTVVCDEHNPVVDALNPMFPCGYLGTGTLFARQNIGGDGRKTEVEIAEQR